MKAHTIAIPMLMISLASAPRTARAQVWNGDFTIHTASDIATLSGYTEVTGYLLIMSDRGLVNLTGLESLTRVGGSLTITSYDLADLTGLESLTSVGGQVRIHRNDNLVSLAGLYNLTAVGTDLEIERNQSLANLYALRNLTQVGSRLTIEDNDVLTSLAGLENLETFDFLKIVRNDALTSLTGFGIGIPPGAEILSLQIWDNSALTSLAGLENIAKVSGSIFIAYNNALTSLVGLNVVESDSSVNIHSNHGLTTLAGLDSLAVVHNISISFNSALTSVEAIGHLYSANSINIRDNASLPHIGLANLHEVSFLEIVQNDSLTTLGLENLRSVGSSGGRLVIEDNPMLLSCRVTALATDIYLRCIDHYSIQECVYASDLCATNCTGNLANSSRHPVYRLESTIDGDQFYTQDSVVADAVAATPWWRWPASGVGPYFFLLDEPEGTAVPLFMCRTADAQVWFVSSTYCDGQIPVEVLGYAATTPGDFCSDLPLYYLNYWAINAQFVAAGEDDRDGAMALGWTWNPYVHWFAWGS